MTQRLDIVIPAYNEGNIILATLAERRRGVIERIEIALGSGFCYSLEVLAKCHRLGWAVADVPAKGFERKQATNRFQVLKWVPAYLRWYLFAFTTTFLHLPANSVKQRPAWKTAK